MNVQRSSSSVLTRSCGALTLAVALSLSPVAIPFVAPAADAAPAKPKVTVTAPASAKVGATVTFRGKVSGRSARATVVLQRRTASGWVKVRTAKVAQSKKYVVRTKARRGATVYRVSVRATGKIAAARSRTVKVTGRRAVGPSAKVNAAVRRILADTNAFRVEKGRAPLKLDAAMTKVATDWSATMIRTGNFEHNPRYSSQIPDGWVLAAENIAAGQSVSSVVDAWINSPGHRANLLDDHTHIGIGVAYTPSGSPYYTQVFANYPNR